MSLEQAAKHLESKGRHGDDMLVHMSKGEVKSLQQLAEAHGGSLTINPETGLPEAGFLRAIMPTIIGAGVGVATGNPYLGAAAAGAYGYSETGTITGGLLAGMQGYGGAGLTAGMTVGTAGTQLAAGEAEALAAQQELARQKIAEEALKTSQSAGLNELAVHAGENVGDNLARGINGAGVEVGTIAPATSPYSGPLTTGPSLEQAQMDKFIGADGGASALNQVPTNSYVNPYTTTAAEAGTYGTAPPTTVPTGASNVGYQNGADLGGAGSSPTNMGAPQSNWDILNKNATFKNLSYALVPGMLSEAMQKQNAAQPGQNTHGTGDVFEFSQGRNMSGEQPISPTGVGQSYFPQQGYRKKGTYSYASGGPVEQMSNQNAIGANTGFPQANVNTAAYSAPYQTPSAQNIIRPTNDTMVDPYTGEERFAGGGLSTFMDSQVREVLARAKGQNQNSDPGQQYSYDPEAQEYKRMATGGISDAHYNLGGYSDGGRLLRGPGDGVSDSIPAVIGHKQPARLADGEFVVPARIVSELGNGSTEAGARKLYAMMDRVQKARGKTVGKGKVATNTKADKNLPA